MRLLSTIISAATLTFGLVTQSAVAHTGTPMGAVIGSPTADCSPMESIMKSGQMPLPGNAMKTGLANALTNGYGSGKVQMKLPETLSRINLRGELIATNSWSQYMGLYNISTKPSVPSEMLTYCNYSFQYGLVDDLRGTLTGIGFSSYRNQVYMCKYNTKTWEMEYFENPENTFTALSVTAAFDPTDGEIYGVFFNNDMTGYTWGKADWDNFTSKPICEVGEDHLFMSLSADSKGQFYAVSWNGDKLYRIDKATGKITSEVAITPAIPTITYVQGGCLNEKDNVYLQTYYTEEGSGLMQIDLQTGESSKVIDFPNHEEFIGLYISPAIAEDKAPDTPTLSVRCQNGSMTADITLTAPTTLYDWSPAEGQTFDYVISANGKELATGKIACGEEITKNIEMEESGNTTFTAIVSNAAGSSPEATANCYIGKGTPARPSGVKLNWSNGVATLSWSPVYYSADGGYIDVGFITYTVLDAEGNVLAKEISERTFTQDVPEPEGALFLKYFVVANYAGKSSEPSASNSVFLGEFIPPFTIDLRDDDTAKMHSVVVDANGDGTRWMQHYLNGLCMLPSEKGHDDWVFSPQVTLKANKTYKLTVAANSEVSTLPERLEVKIGKSSEVESMKTTVIAPATVTAESAPLEGYITVAEDGKYNLGFHAISDPNSSYLYLKEYSISAPLNNQSPAAVENVKVLPNSEGELAVDISFEMPKLTVEGNDLVGDVKVVVKRNDVEIANYDLPAGSEVKLTDNVPEAGVYQYRFETLDFEGNVSKDYTVSVSVGPRTPVTPENVKLIQTGVDSYQMTWDAVTTDVEGNAIDPKYISYTICTVTFNEEGAMQVGEEISGITANSYTYKPSTPITKQGYLMLGVTAVNRSQKSRQFAIGYCWTGTPYQMPVVYSGPSDNYVFTFSSDPEGASAVLLTPEKAGIPSQDADDYMIAIQSSAIDQRSTFSTGTIAITGDEPTLVFYAYPLHGLSENGMKDSNITIISVMCDGEETELLRYSNEDLPAGQWSEIKVDLSEYVGKDVRIGIGTICKGYILSVFDNIQIADAAGAGIKNLTFETHPLIKAENGNIVVEGVSDQKVMVFSVDGKVLYSQKGDCNIPVSPGLYLVRAAETSKKLMVR